MKLDENGIDGPDVQPGSTREKASFVVVGLLAVILAPVMIFTAVFSGNTTSEKYSIDQQSEIKILVLIKAREFLDFSTRNVCDGTGELSGLWRSEVQVRTDSWIRKASLGQGTLNSDGACEYRISVTPPSDFEGGEVIASATLPLGKSEDAIGDTGYGTSFKEIILTYNLG
jgi:hypothetical protein